MVGQHQRIMIIALSAATETRCQPAESNGVRFLRAFVISSSVGSFEVMVQSSPEFLLRAP